MRLTEILRLVWRNLLENKIKVMLTSLGLVVGTATIVLVIAIGQGGKEQVSAQFKNLNAGSIEVKVSSSAIPGMGGMPGAGVMPMPGANQGGRGSSGGSGFGAAGDIMRQINRLRPVRLDEEDLQTITELVPNIERATIWLSQSTEVFGGTLEEATDATLVGALEGYDAVNNLTLLYGDFIAEDAYEAERYTAVLGYDLALEIFGHPALAPGDYVEIEDKNYRVVGVLAQMGSVSNGISPDSALYIPYQTALKYIVGNNVQPVITCVATGVEHVEQAIANIETVLKDNHSGSNFSITDAGVAMQAAASSANTLAMLLFAVATIVFVVGGIGVMNVLFVSVRERTPEIGILKAVGCPASTILIEFLLEAVFMGVAGGILGIASSFALVPLLESLGMTLKTTAAGYLLAFMFSVASGAIFGFYPAYKASQLVPIEALALNA
jgi:putative ABC transport system permease protein